MLVYAYSTHLRDIVVSVHMYQYIPNNYQVAVQYKVTIKDHQSKQWHLYMHVYIHIVHYRKHAPTVYNCPQSHIRLHIGLTIKHGKKCIKSNPDDA